MNAFQVPFGLLGLVAFALVVPPWVWFVDNRTSTMPPEVQVLTALALPAIAALFVASWLQPRGGV